MRGPQADRSQCRISKRGERVQSFDLRQAAGDRAGAHELCYIRCAHNMITQAVEHVGRRSRTMTICTGRQRQACIHVTRIGSNEHPNPEYRQ